MFHSGLYRCVLLYLKNKLLVLIYVLVLHVFEEFAHSTFFAAIIQINSVYFYIAQYHKL